MQNSGLGDGWDGGYGQSSAKTVPADAVSQYNAGKIRWVVRIVPMMKLDRLLHDD